MTGIVISQLAERMPERISSLLFVGAYLKDNCRAMIEAITVQWPPSLESGEKK